MRYTDPNVVPTPLLPIIENVPEFLKQRNIWVLWRYEYVKNAWTKVPYYAQNSKASVTSPATWLSFDVAVNELKTNNDYYHGLGYIISESVGLVGIDIDECINGNGLDSRVEALIKNLGTYAEKSPSDTGVHIVGLSSFKANTRGVSGNLKVEVYSNARYFTYTGHIVGPNNKDITDITETVKSIVNTLKAEKAEVISNDVTTVLAKLKEDSKIRILFEGDFSYYDNDFSRADMAVVSKIASIVGNNPLLIDAVFRHTPLMRDKWDERRGNNVTYGQRTIEKVLKSKILTSVDSIGTAHISVSDVWDSVKEYRKYGGARGLHPGWDVLERYYRPTPGSLTILVGEPSSGKSTFIDCMVMNMAKRHGWKFCMASFETLPIERHINVLCQIYLGKPTYSFIEGSATDEEMDIAGEFLDKHFRFLLPSDTEMTMSALLTNVREEVLQHGINGLVIDPFTEIDLQVSSGMSEVRLIEHELRRLQQFTRLLEIHTWLLVHPTKSNDSYITTDKVKRPSLYSASGAAHFRNKADFGLVIHRCEDDIVNLYVDKVRYDSTGGRGSVSFVFDPMKKEYRPIFLEEKW